MSVRIRHGSLTLLLMIVGLIALGCWGATSLFFKAPLNGISTINMHIFVDAPSEARQLTFYVYIYNLTDHGVERLGALIATPEMCKRGIRFSFFTRRVFIGYASMRVEGRWVDIPRFRLRNINVFAAAYDPRTRTLYCGSWIGSIDPYYNRTVVVRLKVEPYHSDQVPASQVPRPGQSRSWDAACCRGAVICAVSIPGHGSNWTLYIPESMPIPVASFEKIYWTDDPSMEVWYEEPWHRSGSTTITIDIEAYRCSREPGSWYWFPLNVRFVMAVTGEVSPEPIMRVLVYAVDTDLNGLGSDHWSPSGSRVLVDCIPRGQHGWSRVRKKVSYSLQRISVSFGFESLVEGEVVIVKFTGNVRFTIIPKYFELKIGMYDWSRAPADATRLAIYAYDGSRLRLKAEFE